MKLEIVNSYENTSSSKISNNSIVTLHNSKESHKLRGAVL